MVFLKSNYSQPWKMHVGSQCLAFVPFGAAVSRNQAPCKCCSVPASTPPFGLISVVICWQQKIATYGFPCIWLLHCGTEAWERGHVWWYLQQLCAEETEAGTEHRLVTPKEGPWHRLSLCWIKGAHPESGQHSMDLLWHPGEATAGEGEPVRNKTLIYLHNF